MTVVIERTHLVQSMSPQSSRGVRQASATKNVSMKRWQAWTKEVMKTVSEFLTEAIWQMAKRTENSLNCFYGEQKFLSLFLFLFLFFTLFPSLQITFSLTRF